MNISDWVGASVRMALDGKSFIDTTSIKIHSKEDAVRFIENYGYETGDELDMAELLSIKRESVDLIEKELLCEGESIPSGLVKNDDLVHLLLIASGVSNKRDAAWAGAILRVMHTLAHSQSYLNEKYHDVIRQQIFRKFDRVVESRDGKTFIGPVELNQFEMRKAKTRWSVALKLMHKAENVAADIFDWIGIRFVTNYRADALELLAYLRSEHVIALSNIKPSRSRNTLIDLKELDKLLAASPSREKFRESIQNSPYPTRKDSGEVNLYSGVSYNSIQLTCRQRVKIKQEGERALSFFFPFELQIMDRHSYFNSREGFASHKEYKKRQKNAIRHRILPFLKRRRANLD